MMRRRAITLLAILAAYAIPVLAAHGQSTDDDGKTIVAVRVEKNRVISTETVVSKLRTKPGDKLSQDVINEDLKRLYGTEYFSDVSVDVKEQADGVVVTLIVEEKPVIDTIEFKGNKSFRTPKFLSLMKSKPDEMLNLALLAQDIAEIRDFYVKKGYPLV